MKALYLKHGKVLNVIFKWKIILQHFHLNFCRKIEKREQNMVISGVLAKNKMNLIVVVVRKIDKKMH